MSHPYRKLPASHFWRAAVTEPASRAIAEVDPVVSPKFRFAAGARLATAGSCFAQHVSRHLALHGIVPFVTEPAHPLAPPDLARAFGYGDFTARTGNVYTARQLHQLLRRAFGTFDPVEDVWQDERGAFVDPFRPRIQPGGFATEAELRADRAQHLAAVRQMVLEMDALVFTLGLTECWRSRLDGAVYPLCPGVAGGVFDPGRHEFANLTVAEVETDLLAVVDQIHALNPAAKTILTVSPVPLAATAADRHVLVATTYSKSALRVAAEMVERARDEVAYFPSYEIVTGPHAGGAYFAADRRSVTEEGVRHVMRLFLRHYLGIEAQEGRCRSRAPQAGDDFVRQAIAATELQCDEEVLEGFHTEREIRPV